MGRAYNKSWDKRKYVHTELWIEKTEGKSLGGRPRRRWQNEIKLNSKVVGEKALFWVHEVRDRDQWQVLVKRVMNILREIF
jgi:hypothetical protein